MSALYEQVTFPRCMTNPKSKAKKVMRLAIQASHTKLLDEEAAALINAAQALVEGAQLGREHQKRAEVLHAEWEAVNGPDLEWMH